MFFSRRYSVMWGVLLILIGGLFMLSPLGLITINVWDLIFPGFLVFVGLWILIGMFSHSKTYYRDPESVNIPIDGAERARIRLRHKAGRLHVSGTTSADHLVEGSIDAGADYDVRRDNGTLEVDLSSSPDMWPRMFNSRSWRGCGWRSMWSHRPASRNWHERGSYNMWPRMFSCWNWGESGLHDWNLALNGDIPLEFSVESGSTETKLNLSELCVTDLNLKTNMSVSEVTLPAKCGRKHARFRDTMGDVKVYVPDGVAALIHVTDGWANVSVNEYRFPRNGDVYQSPDYDSSENKIKIDAKSDMGILKII